MPVRWLLPQWGSRRPLGEVVDKDQVDRYSVCQRGISVPSGDADAFAAGLQRLIEDVNP